MRNSIERAILTTILYRDLSFEKDFDKLVDYVIDFKLFKSNITCKATAKAIFNQGDLPFDDELILNYLTKRMEVNMEEWINILSTSNLGYDMMIRYVDELKSMDKDEMLKEKLNDI